MRTTALISTVLLLPRLLLAGNWPDWRGPTHDGITTERDFPEQWSATENVKWKAALPGPGNSTPVVWGDKVFVTQAVPEKNQRLLICFDRKDGQVLWQKGTVWTEKEESHEANPLCSASPATDGRSVAAWFGSAGMFCYDLEGNELWKRDLGRQHHEWGYASSPVFYKDMVFLNFGPGENSFVGAFDKKTGKDLWRVPVIEKHHKDRKDGFAGQDKGVNGSWATPLIVSANGRDDLVLALPDRLSGFDPRTGKEIWFCRGLNPLIYTTPTFGEGLIVANGGFHGPDMVVKPGGNGDVTDTHKLWEGGRTGNRLGSVVIRDGLFYAPTMPGIMDCIDLKTGKQIWSERTRGKGPNSDTWSSPVLAGDKIFIVNQSAETIVLRASPKFELIRANSLANEKSNSSLVISDGDIFIRTWNHLWCIGRTTRTAQGDGGTGAASLASK